MFCMSGGIRGCLVGFSKLDLDILNELEELFSKVEETAERLHYLNTDLEMQERNWKSVYNLKIQMLEGI